VKYSDFTPLKSKKIRNRIKSYYIIIILNQSIEPLQIIIIGIAKTDKSYLINVIQKRLHKITIVFILTGIVAFNIQGNTIHSALSILIFSINFELEDKFLKKFQKKLKDIQYVIINEINIIRHYFLALVNL